MKFNQKTGTILRFIDSGIEYSVFMEKVNSSQIEHSKNSLFPGQLLHSQSGKGDKNVLHSQLIKKKKNL